MPDARMFPMLRPLFAAALVLSTLAIADPAIGDEIAPPSGEARLTACEAKAVAEFGYRNKGHLIRFTIARDETLEQNSYDAKIGSQYVAAEIVGLAQLDYEAHDGRPATTISLPFICLHGGEGSDALYVGIVTAG